MRKVRLRSVEDGWKDAGEWTDAEGSVVIAHREPVRRGVSTFWGLGEEFWVCGRVN